jgi:Carboxypeptidase regulatory-like domain/TonB-dependent Receptor Plug Domain
MLKRLLTFAVLAVAFALFFAIAPTMAQLGNSGSLAGTVKDPSGGVVAGASVEISYPVSGFQRQATTDADGNFKFTNVPFNPYHLTVTAEGFAPFTEDVDVRSLVPLALEVRLKLATSATSITVEAGGADLIETEPSAHTDVDTGLIEKLPLESQSSSVSSLVTLASPGVVADSNGLFHGLGDHAENSFSVDGQPITDQQSKVFSNQIPLDSIQSLEVVSGGPPAEYGDKTSLVIKVTTRSGVGVRKPTGSLTSSYGSFGSVTGGFQLAYGGEKWGNFIAANGLNTSRFLDPPEFQALHDKGNEENLFDRLDFNVTGADSLHTNFQYTRSWFQTPNTLDNLNVGVSDPVTGQPLPATDQRALINTFNVAPVWTRLISTTTLFTFGAFLRHDHFNYYPTGNVFADGTGLIPSGSSATVNQDRRLTNAGLRSDLSYVKGANNVKAGITFQHTFLTENFNFAITDPNFLPSETDANGNPCFDTATNQPIDAPCTELVPFDLTRGGAHFPFHGHTDVKELAAYLQDAVTKGPWSFSLGVRADVYRGIVHDWQPEPRVGVAYNVKKTASVLRVFYSRVLETPFNENLILSSLGASNPVIVGVIGGTSLPAPIRSGQRNQFNAGFQQAFGRFLVVDADYLWKYTHNGYDFSAFGNTPIFFPIAWKNSKIDGPSVRVSLPDHHGLTAFAVLAHVRARYFPPQVGGLGATVTGGEVFRIDHDQAFNQTTHLQYQPWKRSPWIAFNWRYDSGLVASSPLVADFPTALAALNADQQAAIGLYCGNHAATPSAPLTPAICSGQTPFGAKLLDLAAPGTNDPDRNPTRVRPRHLFDASVGDDDLFHNDRYKWSLRLTAVNLTNKTAIYNFLSTFSGTHFVTPRAFTAELGFHF